MYATNMSEPRGQDSHTVTPTLLVSAPVESRANISKPTLAGRRRSKTESSALQEKPGRASAIEWVDIDNNDPARRRRTSKRRATASSGTPKGRKDDFDLGRFLPRLGRILESTDVSSVSRPHKKGGEPRKKSERSTVKSSRQKDDQVGAHRRPVKHRVGGLSRLNQPTFKVNPSLLSVISGLTAISDSSSNTTITQQSYNHQRSSPIGSNTVHRRSESAPVASSSPTLNVFEYMDSASLDGEDRNEGSDTSSASSSDYSPSDDGSSEAPQTPSSGSTFPSPTATRSGSLTGSLKESRLRYDPRSAGSADSPATSRPGSECGTENLDKPRRRSHAAPSDAGSTGSHGSRDDRRPRTSQINQPQHPQHQHQHHLSLSTFQPGQQLVEPVHHQDRSHSTSSDGSAGSHGSYGHYMTMQQYHYPSAPAHMVHPPPHQAARGSIAYADRPPAPDAPDLSQRTLAGYEMLAQVLASVDSPVKPVYRKFEYLNHRILLHLQDELCEMEEQLRTMDEIIAQMEEPAENVARSPASRRGDALGGSDMHHRRTALLGRIFLKTEQYNRAISSFASLTKDSRPAKISQVAAYRDWMEEKSPIHNVEARFLQNEQDLVQPGMPRHAETSDMSSQQHPSKHAAALSCLPVALMLPLLLYSIIPTLAGRLVVTLLIGIGAFLVAATTTRIRHMMPLNEWAVCGGAYVLIMAAIAGCIPQHST